MVLYPVNVQFRKVTVFNIDLLSHCRIATLVKSIRMNLVSKLYENIQLLIPTLNILGALLWCVPTCLAHMPRVLVRNIQYKSFPLKESYVGVQNQNQQEYNVLTGSYIILPPAIRIVFLWSMGHDFAGWQNSVEKTHDMPVVDIDFIMEHLNIKVKKVTKINVKWIER